jgi:hypothetical protein
MSLDLGQAAVGTVSAVKVCTVPSSPYFLTLVAGTAASVYVGAVPVGGSGTAVTVSNGATIPANGSVMYGGFVGSAAADIYAVASSPASLSYHLCTDS